MEIPEGWHNRQTTYDIISQKKQSDVTLGYERVHDTESGRTMALVLNIAMLASKSSI